MQISLFKNLDHLRPETLKKPVITIGNFDGMHRGHKKIIEEVIREARRIDGTPILMTFSPHPLKLFKGEHDHLITTLEQKVRLAKSEGIEQVICIEFTKELAALSPKDFIRNFIDIPFKPQDIFVGHDFNFGKGRKGTPEQLQAMAGGLGFRVHIIDEILHEGVRISSSIIRRFLDEGRIEKASSFLGHDYFLSGTVVRGKGLGREIGFPTANIKTINELIPSYGVYQGYSLINGKRENAVMNIGIRPTVEREGERTIEAFFIDLQESVDLYEKNLDIYFERKIREEQKFSGIEELKGQIKRDIESVRGRKL